MTVKNVSMGAPFDWLMKGLDVGRRNPGALFGGFLWLLAVGLLPSVIQIAGDALAAPGSAAYIAAYALSLVLSLVLMPPLMGAAFRLLDRCERGEAVAASDIFDGYRLPGFARHMVLLSLAFVAVYVVALAALLLVLPGKDALLAIVARMAAAPPGGQPDMSGLAPPPGGFFLWLLGAMFLLTLLGNAYMLAFAQAALRGRGVLDTLRDGFAGALRNLLPFLGFAIAMAFVGFVLLLIAAVVIALVVGLLAMASKLLAVAVAIPLYLVLMLALYVVMFGFYYHGWREIFDLPAATATDDTLAA